MTLARARVNPVRGEEILGRGEALQNPADEDNDLSHPNRNNRLTKNHRNFCQGGKGEIVPPYI